MGRPGSPRGGLRETRCDPQGNRTQVFAWGKIETSDEGASYEYDDGPPDPPPSRGPLCPRFAGRRRLLRKTQARMVTPVARDKGPALTATVSAHQRQREHRPGQRESDHLPVHQSDP